MGDQALWFLYGTLYVMALGAIVHVLLTYRTAQSASAWILALVAIPTLALPCYFLFGRNKFEGYVAARRMENNELARIASDLREKCAGKACAVPAETPELTHIADLMALPFTRDNACTLLVNGGQTYTAMFEAIISARKYILLEFYMVRDDNVGRQLSDLLLQKLQAGVSVHFLYDDIGSAWLSRRYIRRLERAGAFVRSFNTASKRPKRLQINFRNHRKILVIDGTTGFVGGLNIGNEYMGRSHISRPWRDTHVQLVGAAVHALQLTFLEDWYWSAAEILDLNWTEHPPRQPPETCKARAYSGAEKHVEDFRHVQGGEAPEEGASVLLLPTSAADQYDTCELFICNAIHNARERIWIASPYFVPDPTVVSALQLAALRGVDVCLIIPARPDNLLVHFAAHTYFSLAEVPGLRILRYKAGFMHQKVMLVDDRYATVGTVNLDHRSLHLNFEVTAIVVHRRFVRQIEEMLRNDLAHCEAVQPYSWAEKPFWFRLCCQSARLLAPLL